LRFLSASDGAAPDRGEYRQAAGAVEKVTYVMIKKPRFPEFCDEHHIPLTSET
jgi:hypothetical protein